MTKHRTPNPAAKPWVPLTDVEKPFDQTNGVVDFDVEAAYDPGNDARDLLEKGIAANVITISGGF
jgi:hypothetical protein